MSSLFISAAYLVATFLFILGLKWMGKPITAVKGNLCSAIGMGIAIIATLFEYNILSFTWIFTGLLVGSAIGYWISQRIQMTAMPEMVALLNGLGGGSSLLVGLAAVQIENTPNLLFWIVIVLSIIIGTVTLTGSLIAWGKLSERIPSPPFLLPGQKWISILLIGMILGLSLCLPFLPHLAFDTLILIACISGLLGILSVLSIGGGDMPVVISLLNSYSGLAACAAGFATQNTLLIIAGALVGASGIILTNIMCKAMNRPLSNVLFSGFQSAKQTNVMAKTEGTVHPISVDDAFVMLEAARQVLIVPGYGMAVAQAQHVVRELTDYLEANGCDVRFAIHPVAGRMPGHMNVLLAEANISYDVLLDMDDANAAMTNIDVGIVIGANDVVNPDARDNANSPIYGMPIINIDSAKTVLVLKRSMNKGFAGIENPLFFKQNVRMLFGDAKLSLQTLASHFKDL
jgi:NAD(P) transhydrogenase subunit beta